MNVADGAGEMANAAQRAAWNAVQGPRWIAHEAALEASIAPAGTMLMEAASVRPGERVLEVGCGTGTLLPHLARLSGDASLVTGIDISATMLREAARRAPAVRLREADAQTADLDGPYDLILSRFGVMFFEDPVAAFANLRAALAPGGRLIFACWGRLEENPHWLLPLRLVEERTGPRPPADPHAPGPMALADDARTERLLRAAGFATVSVRTAHFPYLPGDPAAAEALAFCMGPAGALLRERGVDAEMLASLRAAYHTAAAPTEATIRLVAARPEAA